MIWDMQSLFSWDQAITVDAASTNVIDLGAVGTPISSTVPLKRDLGAGGPVPLRIQVTQAFATLTSLNVILQTSDDEAFGSGVVVVAQTGAVAAADLKVGKVLSPQYVPQGANKRYLRLYYDVTGSDATTGKISAGLVTGHQTN
jgi:hypothetical protein